MSKYNLINLSEINNGPSPMRKHSRVIKFSFPKRPLKRHQETPNIPSSFYTSSREIDFLNPRGYEAMRIVALSPTKPIQTEGSQPVRNHNFRIARSPSPLKKREEMSLRGICSSLGSFAEGDSNLKTEGSQDNRLALLMERLEKKEQEREKEKENILKLTRQSRRRPREEGFRLQPKQHQSVEEEKNDGMKGKQPSKELISETDLKKIAMCFRYRVYSLAKIVEDKLHNTTSLMKGSRTTKLRLNNLISMTPTISSANSPMMGRASLDIGVSDEGNILDEVWRLIKVTASTRSKYKFRDVVNYNKRLRETLKSLYPLSLPNQRRIVNINLDDETPTKSSPKKAKFSEESKVNAFLDFTTQKRDNPSTKVFIIIGTYPALRKALESRGWIENPDHTSKDFNLKWTSRVIDIKYDALKANQHVNHFENNIILTTKVGLARNIRNLIWNDNEDIDEFYPRCYDLNDVADFDDFLEDFRFEQAITTLKFAAKYNPEENPTSNYNLLKLKLCIALNVCEKRLRPLDIQVYNMTKNDTPLFTPEEWEVMSLQETDNPIENPKYLKLIRGLRTKFGVEFNDIMQPETDSKLFKNAQGLLATLEKEYPQLSMNQGKNIWIVKPAGLSRGRGICCYNSLAGILDHIGIKESEWVAQKYIENPLIIKNRKFDIRQWVLVTDWSPLTIWFFDECYVRFGAQDFNPEDLSNKYAHLTNNAIGRNAANFETSEIEGNMWDCAELQTYLQELTGKDLFKESILPQMKNIVIKSLQSAPEMAESRKNTFELFGYDFMIDENFKTWMIEINSSPSMDYSTSITERLVKKLLEDCVKVVVDYGMSKSKSKKNIRTGSFQCIFNGRPL